MGWSLNYGQKSLNVEEKSLNHDPKPLNVEGKSLNHGPKSLNVEEKSLNHSQKSLNVEVKSLNLNPNHSTQYTEGWKKYSSYFFVVFDEVGVVPFFTSITFLTIGITNRANFTAVLTTFDTFILYPLSIVF